MKVKIGSLIKFYTILLLSEGPKHGYEMGKRLEEKLGHKISTSQVYPFLNTLLKNDLVEVSKTGERDKKIYKLTEKGENFVNNTLQRFGDLLHIAIEPKLTECAHCGCKIFEGGHKEKIGDKDLVFCCHHCAMALKNGHKDN